MIGGSASGIAGVGNTAPPRRIRVLPLVVAAFAWPAVACDGTHGHEQLPGAIVRDSAGVQIVENRLPLWGPGDEWTFGHEPEFSLGDSFAAGAAQDSSHLFWRVRGVAPLSDGRLVVLTPEGDRKVVIFERSGAFSNSFGRRGRGPGEFFNPQHLQVLEGDTIVVWDFMFGTVARFSPQGNLLGERRIDLGALIEAVRTPTRGPGETIYQPLPDGSFLMEAVRPDWRPPDEWGLYRPPTGYVRIDTTYAVHGFGWWDGQEYFHGDSPWVPFALRSIAAAGGTPARVYVTNGDRYEIHQYTATGTLTRIIRRDVEPRPITADELEDRIQTVQQNLRAPSWTRWERALDEHWKRRTHPAIEGMRVDPRGYLWVLDDYSASQWSVFDSRGRWLGSMTTPTPSFYWIGEDSVLGALFDLSTGVQGMAGYRLDRKGM